MKKAPVLISSVAGLLAGALLTLLAVYSLLPALERRGGNEEEGGSGITNAELTAAAMDAAGYLKSGDFEALSEAVHPDFGLILSPFATVNLKSNLSFTARQVRDLGENGEKLVWGVLADSGEPISMTASEYMARYVMDRDYTSAPVVSVDYMLRVGNSRENVTDIFPGAHYVDLCYPGTPEADNSDWSILRMVFEEYGGELKLAALIHSEATI